MSIVFDSTAVGAAGSTWSHTCGSTARVLFVSATCQNTQSVTGVTYNGVSMTSISSSDDGTDKIYLFYLINPDSGTHTVQISVTGGNFLGSSSSYGGVLQSGIPDSSSIGSSTTTTHYTQSTTTVADNCWTILTTRAGSSSALTADSGSVVRQQPQAGFGGSGVLIDSGSSKTPPGSKTLGVTSSNQFFGAGVMASFAPLTTRYWVGGNGNWDASNTTNWSYTSGGAGGALVPTSIDDVFFDANSGSATVTISATANCANLTCTGFTGTLAGSSALNVYGSMTLVSGMTVSNTGTVTFASTSSGKTITTAGKTLAFPIVFNGSGGAWTFQDNVTSSSSITVTTGTVNLGSLTYTLTGSGTPWTGGGTISAGTSTIKFTDASSSTKTFTGGGKTYYNLWITGSGTGAYTISGSNTFNDFKVDTPPHTINFTAGTTQTVTSFTVNGTAGNLMTLQSTSSGTQWSLACASIISCDYLSLQDSNAIKL